MLALLAAASIVTAVDAERAFVRDARTEGQWTAFRKWADDSAVMFTPQVVWAQDFLKGRADPPRSIDWAPADSWVSCDGRTAINRGPWTGASGQTHGYFTTVWMETRSNWRWIYDGGADLPVPMALPKNPRIVRASCTNLARVPAAYRGAVVSTAHLAGKAPADAGQGRSADGTLIFEWKVAPDGARHFLARLWTGRNYRIILDQNVAAPQRR
jgi:hypothetical protein